MIRPLHRANVFESDVGEGGGFYFAGGKNSVAVGVENQREHHSGRILAAPGSFVVELGRGRVERLYQGDEQPCRVIGGKSHSLRSGGGS